MTQGAVGTLLPHLPLKKLSARDKTQERLIVGEGLERHRLPLKKSSARDDLRERFLWQDVLEGMSSSPIEKA